MKNVQKNNRVRLLDKEDEDLSDGEIDDDIDLEIATKLKSKYETQVKKLDSELAEKSKLMKNMKKSKNVMFKIKMIDYSYYRGTQINSYEDL